MTAEELLKPRYRVIADYPGSSYKVGDIKQCAEIGIGNDSYYKQYPSIFQPLQWWEERTEEQMPTYLKHTIDIKTTFHKVKYWDMDLLIWEGENRFDFGNLKIWDPSFTYQPATKEEYNAFIKSKTTNQ